MTNTPYSSCGSDPSVFSEQTAHSCTTTTTFNTQSHSNPDPFLANGPAFTSDLVPPAHPNSKKTDTFELIQVPHIQPDIVDNNPRNSPRSIETPSNTFNTNSDDEEIDDSDDDADSSDALHHSTHTNTTRLRSSIPQQLSNTSSTSNPPLSHASNSRNYKHR